MASGACSSPAMPAPLTWFRRRPISSILSGCQLRRMLQRHLRSCSRITPPPTSASDSTGLSCRLDAQRNRLAANARLPDREAHARLARRGVEFALERPQAIEAPQGLLAATISIVLAGREYLSSARRLVAWGSFGNRGSAALGHGIARVMRACCSGIASLLVPWVFLGYPLGSSWVALR